MDAKDFEDALGKADDSPEVTRLLSALGVKKKLRPSRDGDDVSVELPKIGVVLVFEQKVPKSSELSLAEAQLYSDAEQGYKTFAGALPQGLSFDDKRDEVRKKLGKPSRIMKDFRLDHWFEKGRRLSIQYRKGDERIANLSLGFPLNGQK